MSTTTARTPTRHRGESRRAAQGQILLVVLVAACAFIVLMWWHPPRSVTGTSRSQAQGLLRVAMTSVVATSALMAPGLVARARISRLSHLPPGMVPLPGLALMTLVGLLGWWMAPAQSATVDRIGVLVVLIVIAIWSRGTSPVLDRSELVALGVAASVFVVALGRSLWSLGPDGELYAGQISRTLEVGDRPDSRISYHVTSVIANGLDPFGGAGAQLFAPYAFLDRGPLPGLISTPFMFAVGTRPSVGFPDQPWSVFDTQGFMTYRIVMMLLATMVVLAAFTVTRAIGGSGRAEMAALVAGGTPFVVHETWFTWPKLAAASMIGLAAYQLLRNRSAGAGVLAGVGYLFHPLALLAVPTLAFLVLVKSRVVLLTPTRTEPGWARWLKGAVASGASMAGGLALVVGGWLGLNYGHHGTGGFLAYFTEANTQPHASLHAWLDSRAISIGNTVVPLFLFHDPTNPSVNSIYAPSGAVVHFFFQYWIGIAFGGAIVFYPVLLWGLSRAARCQPAIFIAVVILPLLLFATYWGSFDSGLLREGLHPWVLTVLVVWALAWPGRSGQVSRWLRAVLALRLVEVGADMFVPSAWFHRGLTSPGHGLGDVVALSLMLVGLVILAAATFIVLRSTVLRPFPITPPRWTHDVEPATSPTYTADELTQEGR